MSLFMMEPAAAALRAFEEWAHSNQASFRFIFAPELGWGGRVDRATEDEKSGALIDMTRMDKDGKPLFRGVSFISCARILASKIGGIVLERRAWRSSPEVADIEWIERAVRKVDGARMTLFLLPYSGWSAEFLVHGGPSASNLPGWGSAGPSYRYVTSDEHPGEKLSFHAAVCDVRSAAGKAEYV